jgi:hypothetical protein
VTESYLQIPRNVKLVIVYENRADLFWIRPGGIFWLLVVGNGAQATVGGQLLGGKIMIDYDLTHIQMRTGFLYVCYRHS